jgi:hypothetical protein
MEAFLAFYKIPATTSPNFPQDQMPEMSTTSSDLPPPPTTSSDLLGNQRTVYSFLNPTAAGDGTGTGPLLLLWPGNPIQLLLMTVL